MIILIICIGKYRIFLREFLFSCTAMFFPSTIKYYHIVTDDPDLLNNANISKNINITLHITNKTKWPEPTIFRFRFFEDILKSFINIENSFFFNINCRFTRIINDLNWIEHDLVSCIHPGFFNKTRSQFTYEDRIESTAYISPTDGEFYYAGGIQGGRTQSLLDAYSTCESMRAADEMSGITAIWHDESYWNKYLLNKSSYRLDPGHLYPEGWNLPFQMRISLLNKELIQPVKYLRSN